MAIRGPTLKLRTPMSREPARWRCPSSSRRSSVAQSASAAGVQGSGFRVFRVWDEKVGSGGFAGDFFWGFGVFFFLGGGGRLVFGVLRVFREI